MKKTLTVLTLGAFLPLCAQIDNLRFGVQGVTSTPTGRMHKENKQSLGLGAFAKYDVGQGHGLVANIGAEKFSDKKLDKVIHNKLNTYSVGVDYTYHINQQQDGLYALVGVNGTRSNTHVYKEGDNKEATKVNKKAKDAKAHYNKGVYSLGVGYDLNANLGAQVRYNSHRSNKKNVGAVTVGVAYTF